MNATPLTIIFDFGGVLLRTEDRAPRTQLAEFLGLTYEALDEIVFGSQSARLASVGKLSAEQHWLAVASQLNWPPEEIPALQRAFWGGDQLDEDLITLLRSLRTSNGRYRTALLSNAWDDLRAGLERYWHIADAFDHIFISAELGLAKPDPEIYTRVQTHLEAPPESIIFVDDFQQNIEAARAAGWHGIHFQNSGQAQAELRLLLKKMES